MAHHWVAFGYALPIRVAAWYRETEATFSGVLTMVCRALWAEKYLTHSTNQLEPHGFIPEAWEVLLDQLASTT